MASPLSSRGVAPPPGGAPFSAALVLLAFAALALARTNPAPGRSPNPAPSPSPKPAPSPPELQQLPTLLSQTGFGSASALPYSPQYPLWSDGAAKRRFVSIPKGESIDGSDPDDWRFPVGTRFWKELSFGQRVETRYLEKLPDGSVRFASYVWDQARGDAVLAPEAGIHSMHALGPGVAHDIPSRADCRSCHEGRRSLVLGFNALQLSSDRDPLAPHREALPPDAVDLGGLVERGLLRNLPADLLATPPRIAAPSATSRAAQGYLFGNCAGCHNARGPLADLGLDFDQPVLGTSRALNSSVARASHFRLPGEHSSLRIAPGDPQRSAVWFRMNARDAYARMPPLGTKLVDRTGTDLVSRFIARELSPSLRNQGK